MTATATPSIRQSIVHRLRLRNDYKVISLNPNRPELRFVVYNKTSPGFKITSRQDKLRILLRILRAADKNNESVIVYVNTTREAQRLARRLESAGFDARYYHGKMDDQARKDVQDMFLDGQINVIVATKAFGMGVDKPDIRYVVHYQIPADLESYFQEAGRAGRDGHISWCILLYHDSDLWIHENYFIPNSLPDPDQLRSVLAWLTPRCTKGRAFIDPSEMADALGFDDQRELGIHLHLLEELGFLRRDTDVTLKASTRLLEPLNNVADAARRISSGPVGDALFNILQTHHINDLTRAELNVVAAAFADGIDPVELDSLLYQLSLRGHIIYRAFARAFTLVPTKTLTPGQPIPLDTLQLAYIRQEMEHNLKAMRHYAESLIVGDCLRAEILQHFGEQKPPTRRDQCCSLCDVNLATPWSAIPAYDDLSEPSRYRDPKYETLRAIAWNAGLANQPGRAPYGTSTLAHIITGNDYAATRYQDDAERRRIRRKLIVASDHFGVLEGIPRGHETILNIIDQLRHDGFITDITGTWDAGQYQYPAPTEKGLTRLQQGQLFADQQDT